MSVLLPAPFSPQSAWTSPFSRSNDTRSSARTPGNSLVISTSSSSGIGHVYTPSAAPGAVTGAGGGSS